MIIGQCWVCNTMLQVDNIDDTSDNPPAWQPYHGDATDGAISAICQACQDGGGSLIEIAMLPDVI